MKTNKNIKKIIVHSGQFHLDDIICVALCRLMNPDCEIERNNKPDLTKTGPETGIVVADVGMVHDPEKWLFDHHQDKYTPDDDPKTVRAACGRVWDYFGDPESYPALTAYIRAVDLHDTGVKWTSLGVIGSFAPQWNDDFTMEEGFERALNHVMEIIKAIIHRDEAELAAYDAVAAYPVENDVIIMERYLPWHRYVSDHEEIKAVVFPGRDPETWTIGVPKGKAFPEEWLDSKPDGLIFMPAWRTMAVVDSVERAKELVEFLEEESV